MSGRSRAMGLAIIMLASLVLIPSAPLAGATGSSVQTCSDGSVWISEIMPSDEGEGWVELQTSSWDTCNLDGWAISSGVAAEEKQFDANDTIVPSWRTNLSNQSDATLLGSQNSTVGDFHITFDVSVDGGMIALESPSGMFTNVSFPGWNAGDGSYHVCVDSTTNNPVWSWTGMENRSSTPDNLNDCPPPPMPSWPEVTLEWRLPGDTMWMVTPDLGAGDVQMNAMAHNLTDGGNYSLDLTIMTSTPDVSYANLLNISVPAFSPSGTSHEWMPWNMTFPDGTCEVWIYGSLIDLDTNMSVTGVYERYGMCMWEEPEAHAWVEWSQNGSENWNLQPGETFEMTAKLIHLVSGTNYSLHVDVLIDNVTVVDTTEQFVSNGSNVGYGYDVTFPDEFCTVEVILILHDESTPISDAHNNTWYADCMEMGPNFNFEHHDNAHVNFDDFEAGNDYDLKVMFHNLVLNESYTFMLFQMSDVSNSTELINVSWVAMNDWNQENFTLSIDSDACYVSLAWFFAYSPEDSTEVHTMSNDYLNVMLCDEPWVEPEIRVTDADGNDFEIEDMTLGDNHVVFHMMGFEPNVTASLSFDIRMNNEDDPSYSVQYNITFDEAGNATQDVLLSIPNGTLFADVEWNLNGEGGFYWSNHEEVWFIEEPPEPMMESAAWDIELTSSGLVLTQENNWNISTDFAEVWDTVEGNGDGTLTAAELDAEICPDDDGDDDGAELAFNFPQDGMMSINGDPLSMDISSMTCTVSSTEHASGMHATITFSMTYRGTYTADAMGELVWDIEARDDGDSDVYWNREDKCVWNDDETEWDCFYWDQEDDEYHESTWWYYCEFIGASDATEVDRWMCTDDFGRSDAWADSANNTHHLDGTVPEEGMPVFTTTYTISGNEDYELEFAQLWWDTTTLAFSISDGSGTVTSDLGYNPTDGRIVWHDAHHGHDHGNETDTNTTDGNTTDTNVTEPAVPNRAPVCNLYVAMNPGTGTVAQKIEAGATAVPAPMTGTYTLPLIPGDYEFMLDCTDPDGDTLTVVASGAGNTVTAEDSSGHFYAALGFTVDPSDTWTEDLTITWADAELNGQVVITLTTDLPAITDVADAAGGLPGPGAAMTLVAMLGAAMLLGRRRD